MVFNHEKINHFFTYMGLNYHVPRETVYVFVWEGDVMQSFETICIDPHHVGISEPLRATGGGGGRTV